jgi:hypothetical protein
VHHTWRAVRGSGQRLGTLLAGLSLAMTFVFALLAREASGATEVLWLFATVAGCLATVALVYLLLRLRSLTYTLTGSELIVAAIGLRLVISYTEIRGVVYRPRDVIEVDRYERFGPVFYDGLTNTSEGRWRSIATTRPSERVRINTFADNTIAISPERPVLFVEALEAGRRNDGSQAAQYVELEESPDRFDGDVPSPEPQRVAISEEESCPGPSQGARVREPLAMRVFRDRILRGDAFSSRLLAISLLILLTMVFIAAWKSDSVTRPLALRWDPDGEPTWYVRPDGFWLIDGVWIFPVTAAAVIVVNTALATLAAAFGRMIEARLLLAGAVMVSVILMIAIARATGLI